MTPPKENHDQETELSSECESFSSTFTNTKVPTKFNRKDKSNILILSAARLELESITLKEAMEDAIKKLREISMTDVTNIAKQVSQIKQDIEVLKVANRLDQSSIDRATQEFANVRNAVISYCSQQSNTSINAIDEMKGLRLGIMDQLNKMFNILGNTQILVHQFSLNQQPLQEKLEQQRLNYENLHNQIMSQNKDIQEIKQFLQLLLPRIVSIENSHHSLLSNKTTPTPTPPMKNSKKRKLM